MKNLLIDLYEDEKGQGLSEYGLIIALIAVVCIGALTAIGIAIKNKFTEVNEALQ